MKGLCIRALPCLVCLIVLAGCATVAQALPGGDGGPRKVADGDSPWVRPYLPLSVGDGEFAPTLAPSLVHMEILARYSFAATGMLTNSNEQPVEIASITALLYGVSGEVVGTKTRRLEWVLNPGSQVPFHIFWEEVDDGEWPRRAELTVSASITSAVVVDPPVTFECKEEDSLIEPVYYGE